jgi:hypothetical protein
MKPFYSIQEIANLLNEDVHATCNALVASKVDCYFNGKKVDLTEYECFRPMYSGEAIFVRTGCAPEPEPDTILISVESLPASWTQRIQDSEATSNSEPLQECAEICQVIHGGTFARLKRAIAAFPDRYPDYKTKKPKLTGDVRVWLIEVSLAMNGREAHVFGAIIAEHFDLSGDTQRT